MWILVFLLVSLPYTPGTLCQDLESDPEQHVHVTHKAVPDRCACLSSSPRPHLPEQVCCEASQSPEVKACLPTFIIAGFQKCGTTALAALLDAHPNIAMSELKEVHFFDKNKNYKQGLQQYANQFQTLPGTTKQSSSSNRQVPTFITGEATPFYLADKYACARMQKHLPHMRLLVMVRDPVKRAYSEYQMKRRRVTEQDNLMAAVEAHAAAVYSCFLDPSSTAATPTTATAAAATTQAVLTLDALLPARKGSNNTAAAQQALEYSAAVGTCIAAVSAGTAAGAVIASSGRLVQQIKELTKKLSAAAIGHSADVSARRALLETCFPLTANGTTQHTVPVLCDVAATSHKSSHCDDSARINTTSDPTAAAATTAASGESLSRKSRVSNSTAAMKLPHRSFNKQCWYRLEHALPLDTVIRDELALLNECYAHARSSLTTSSSTDSQRDSELLAAVDAQIGVKGLCIPLIHNGITDQYLYRSLYALQLHRCMRHIPAQQLMVIDGDDLKLNQQQTLDSIHAFLGVPAYNYSSGISDSSGTANTTSIDLDALIAKKYPGFQSKTGWRLKSQHEAMSAQLERELREFFLPHNTMLFAMLQRNFSAWA